MALDELARERSIGFGARSSWSVFKNRFPKARCLAQANTPWNHRLVNAVAEMLAHLRHHLLAKIRPPIVHRHNNPAELEPLVRT